MRKMIIPLLVTIGSLLASVSAWVQYNNEKTEEEKNNKLTIENQKLLSKLYTSSQDSNDQISAANEKLFSVSKELIVSRNELIKFQETALNEIIGGKIPSIFYEIEKVRANHVIRIGVQNNGNLVLKDVNITFFDGLTDFEEDPERLTKVFSESNIQQLMDNFAINRNVKMYSVSSLIPDHTFQFYNGLIKSHYKSNYYYFNMSVVCRSGKSLFANLEIHKDSSENGFTPKLSIKYEGKDYTEEEFNELNDIYN